MNGSGEMVPKGGGVEWVGRAGRVLAWVGEHLLLLWGWG
jgi:hypothetical protein